MSYVLTVIHPPTDGAAYGKAVVMGEEVIEVQHAGNVAGDVLIRMDVPVMAARRFGNDLARLGTAVIKTHQPSGFAFRIDPITNAPHPCPCCGRIVLPADLEGALCGGCYTFDDTEQCLPENTAHPTEDTP